MTIEKQAVLNAVMNYLDSYSRKEIENCMLAISTSTPILLFGTNDNEVFRSADEVRTALNRDFDLMSNIRWDRHSYLHIETSPTLASVVIELSISYQSEGKHIETPFRYALTLIKEDLLWKICSGMACVPFPTGTYAFPR
jgi:hypothetical protein